MEITHASTFSGIGASEVAAEMLGWKNNRERVEAKDLNESNDFKCACYLAKFTVSGVDENGNFVVRKQK